MLRYRTMHAMVVDEIGARIVTGRVASGDVLPVENDLAAELGVSRGALREAVKALVAKGMLLIRPRTGTRVLPATQWNHLDRDVLRWHHGADPDRLLGEITELRRTIEPTAAGLAAARATGEQTRALHAAHSAMADAAAKRDDGAYLVADTAFHRAVLDACGNRLLASVGRAIEVALEHSFAASARMPGAVDAALPAHRAVVEAIDRRDAEAARSAMSGIIDAAEREIAAARGDAGAGDRSREPRVDRWSRQ